ncbi:MAG TPA: tetratricopeptide repeat protein [archaeon]|nr:tetratricopeptide repeat protein [archaeon]
MPRARIHAVGGSLLFFFLLVSSTAPVGVPALAAARPAADVSGTIQTAQKQFNAGNYSGAIVTLQSAVTQSPSSGEAYFWLGRCYYELHDYNSSIQQLEKSTELDTKNSEYHHWLGIAYGEKADRERSFSIAKKVKKEFEEAVRLNPSNIQARRDLMEYCIDAPWIVGGSKDEGRAQIDAIEKLDPVEAHLARAVFYQVDKKPELAEKEYRDALNSKPKRVEPYFEAANFFARQNKAADLDAAIQSAALVSANDPRLSFYRGVSVMVSGANFSRGEEYLKSYLASTPDRSDWPSHAAARDWLGRIFEAEGKRTEAAEQYRAALQLDPERKETRQRLEQLEKKSK